MKLTDLLNAGADGDIAISAPSRASLNFLGLRQLVASTCKVLNDAGMGRNDRVAIVLPNGPEMASCYLACACAVTSAPLNPAYRVEEFEFYLDDLQACALIIEKGSNSPAVAAAQKLGIRTIELSVPEGACAGQFTLAAGEAAHCDHGGHASANDVAMILHTSGTTSKPKRVPLTVDNLGASAKHIAATLQFTTPDVGLNIMPLFHIHGLIAGLLAPLSAGSSVFCTPGSTPCAFSNGWKRPNPRGTPLCLRCTWPSPHAPSTICRPSLDTPCVSYARRHRRFRLNSSNRLSSCSKRPWWSLTV